MTEWLKNEIRPGATFQTKRGLIIPFYQSFSLRVPVLPIYFSWKRPVSILVSDNSGHETVISIQDITRQVVLGLLGASLLFWIAVKIISGNDRK